MIQNIQSSNPAAQQTQQLAQRLEALGGVEIEIRRPHSEHGRWSVMARRGRRWVSVEAIRRPGNVLLGLSHDSDGTVHGEGYSEVPQSIEQAFERCRSLLGH